MNYIIPFYDDDRLEYTSRYLTKYGYHEVYDKNKADFAVFAPAEKEERIEEYKDVFIFLAQSNIDKKKYRFFNYNEREDFKYNNAMLTSEGAVALYKNSSVKALFNSSVLITGYGKIAKALCKVLKSFKADVTVCVRSDINKAQALNDGVNVIDFSKLLCDKFDVIFNTVPAVYFTKKEIDTFNKDMIYIELASFPGGIDKHYAKSKNINFINGSKLPSRFSKESAGYFIAQAIDKSIKEGVIWISDIALQAHFVRSTKQ